MNIYESVTDRILTKLSEGVIPWRKSWTLGLPKSLATGKEYRGINISLLGMSGFTSRYWITFLETKRLGGFIRKGEKATAVYFWHWRTAEEIERLREKTGKKNIALCSSFMSFVFNLDQVEGIERPSDDGAHSNNPIEAAELLLASCTDKPAILHGATKIPAYWPATDEITMPLLSSFEIPSEYYSTLFHEVVHSTGHPKRLNRLNAEEGSKKERYSFEELVAEFGASFLCAISGVDNACTEELSAAYISGWAEVFKKDSHILLRAASAAQQAVDFVRGKSFPDDSRIAA